MYVYSSPGERLMEGLMQIWCREMEAVIEGNEAWSEETLI